LLARTLPPGTAVAVGWEDPLFGTGASQEGKSGSLAVAAAATMLAGHRAGLRRQDLGLAWTLDATRIALVVQPARSLPGALRDGWLALARSTVEACIAAARAQSRIEGMRKSERLRQALYEIADLSGASLDMQEMLARIHAIVCTLMPAENFYIVRYDEVRETLRFLYFVDQRDPWQADPDAEIPLAEMPTSLTVAMLRHGQPMLGSSEQVRRTLGVDTDPGHGPDSADWLGVPMRREGCVSGAVVVQSYDQPQRYTQEDRALLEFVAQHILTALDRKSAQEELERRVDERTRELQHANWVLEAEIVERER